MTSSDLSRVGDLIRTERPRRVSLIPFNLKSEVVVLLCGKFGEVPRTKGESRGVGLHAPSRLFQDHEGLQTGGDKKSTGR